MNETTPRVWVGVISREHVRRGVAGGFTQACHGKRAPLARMQPGDWFIAYSPTTEFKGGAPLKAFTAIGTIRESDIVQVDMGGGFRPFRREVAWRDASEVSLEQLRSVLEFTRDGGWGLEARRGHFEISPKDGKAIRLAMLGC